MASAGDRYLPDLAKCFAGEVTVFSWTEAFQLLSSANGVINTQVLNLLISSTRVKTLLAQKAPSFQPPSQQSRNQFETKTAAINVTPASGKSYDIDEIKKNTIWLSEEVKLAEDEALRLVILCWQQEPIEKLVSGYSDAELASLQEVLGSQNLDQSREMFPRRDDETFDTIESKRERLLKVYFGECIGLLCVSRRLQELALLKDHKLDAPDNLQQFARELDHTASDNTGVANIVDAIELRLRALEGGRRWSLHSEDINDRWVASELQCILTLQEIMLLRIRGSTETVSTQTLLRWMQLMAGCEFFATVQPGPMLVSSQVESLQAIASLTTLAMLDPTTAIQTLSNSSVSNNLSTYFLDGDAAHDLHRVLLEAAEARIPQATPSALAWALILGEIKHQATASKESRESGAVQRAIDQTAAYDSATGRRTSSGSFQQSIYEEVLNAIMNTSDLEEPASYLLRCSIEAAGVFETLAILAKDKEYRSPLLGAMCLQILQELISVAVSSIGYAPEILASQFAILSAPIASEAGIPDPKDIFIKDEFLMDSVFAVAAGRFPYEAVPFLRLCKFLASARIFDDHGTQYVTFRLRIMDSFTQSATGPFASYHTIREDENLNLIALDGAVNMFRGLQKNLLTYRQTEDANSVIPADTLGEVISESIPPVVKWQHSYSGLTLLGVWLELYYLGKLQNLLSPYESADDVVTEIISIITALLQNISGHPSAQVSDAERKQLQDEILNDASHALQSDSDVAEYIFEILEQQLQAYRRRPSSTFNTSILIACIDFTSVYSYTKPDQFWSLFGKSSLLESYGSDSFLLSIVSGVEVPNQNFQLLETCTRLYKSIIQAVLYQPAARTSRLKSVQLTNFRSHSLRLHANVVLSMTQSLYSSFESIPSWSFTSKRQQSHIVASLAKSFERILHYANAIQRSKSGLTVAYVPAADFLYQQLHTSTDEVSSTSSLLRHIFWMQDILDYSQIEAVDATHGALELLLKLATTLIEISRLSAESSSALNLQLFSAVPLLCRNLAKTTNEWVICLLRGLLNTVSNIGTASLLGYLGSTSSICLLEILKLNLGDRANNLLKSSIWDLLSKLVGKNQQWLATVILTGSPPHRITKEDANQSMKGLRGKTFVETALKQLVKVVELDPVVAISMLKFVIKVQMNWSWANEAMKSNKDFLPSILSYVCNTFVDVSDELKVSYRNKLAASITDLSTIYLHYAKANRDTTTLKIIVPLLKWLGGHAIDVSSYKHSLHSNLRKNFASKFNGFELNDFKRTGVFESHYGKDYYYDLDLAHVILLGKNQWPRDDRHRDQSFSAEFCRANLNLSLVDSEVKLLSSFLNLCVEHSGYFAHDAEVQPTVIDIVKNALDANTQTYPSEKIFENVLQTRADISISLLQRLVDAKVTGIEARALLRHAWECARLNNGSFEQAIIDNNLTYWRSMLTIILMTLQFQVDKRYMPPAVDSSPAALLRHTEQAIPTILEIITVVVGQGFRSVVAGLQDQRQSALTSESATTAVSHKDVYFILTIFDTVLRMNRLPEFITEASQRLIAEGAIQSCLLLYSWSHMLSATGFDHEPIYANYCLQFLASLSSLPPVTEELAVEGVLSRLLSSRVTQQLQAIPDGAGHLDKRPQAQALYILWATGLLPVCLNLLHSVGAPVAAEVSIFLNQFPRQLDRASVAFISSPSRAAQTDAITSIVASEATTTALISFILSSYRNAGASAAVDPSTVRSLVGYDEHKKALSEDISDIVNSTTSSLKNRVVATNEKEMSLLREGDGEKLVKKIVSELRNALTCLKGEEVEDDQ